MNYFYNYRLEYSKLRGSAIDKTSKTYCEVCRRHVKDFAIQLHLMTKGHKKNMEHETRVRKIVDANIGDLLREGII